MDRASAGQVVGGLVLVILLWITVYWWWEPRHAPAVTLDPPAPRRALDAPPSTRTPEVKQPIRPTPERSTTPTPTPDGSSPAPSPVENSTRPPLPGQTVIPPEFDTYVILPGDTFPRIARKFFGSEDKHRVIANANPLLDPRRLKPGDKIKIPRDPSNIQGKPVTPTPTPAAPEDPREHTVQSGDTLGSISAEYYGTVRHADKIFTANRAQLKSPDALKIGMKLIIPTLPAE
jgi:nucleoid-associated protein YgaU